MNIDTTVTRIKITLRCNWKSQTPYCNTEILVTYNDSKI